MQAAQDAAAHVEGPFLVLRPAVIAGSDRGMVGVAISGLRPRSKKRLRSGADTEVVGGLGDSQLLEELLGHLAVVGVAGVDHGLVEAGGAEGIRMVGQGPPCILLRSHEPLHGAADLSDDSRHCALLHALPTVVGNRHNASVRVAHPKLVRPAPVPVEAKT